MSTLARNVLVLGFIPGPKETDDPSSFLYPIVQEGIALSKGIRTWCGAEETEILAKAHFCVVGSDMVERRKLLVSWGFHGKQYCEYCTIKGLAKAKGSIYCPHLPPKDAPKAIRDRERGMKDKGLLHYEFKDLSTPLEPCPIKTNKKWRQVVDYLKGGTSDAPLFAKKYGVRGESVLGKLPGIVFPWSFPPDHMHLLDENIEQKYTKMLRGVFFAATQAPASGPELEHNSSCSEATATGSKGDDEETDAEQTQTQTRKRREKRQRRQQAGTRAQL